MAPSSIGQVVALDNEGAERLIKIPQKPYKPTTAPGEPLRLSHLTIDRRKSNGLPHAKQGAL